VSVADVADGTIIPRHRVWINRRLSAQPAPQVSPIAIWGDNSFVISPSRYGWPAINDDVLFTFPTVLAAKCH
jgi:hypothetical protein